MDSACLLGALSWSLAETHMGSAAAAIQYCVAAKSIPDDDVIEAVGQEIRKKEKKDVRTWAP